MDRAGRKGRRYTHDERLFGVRVAALLARAAVHAPDSWWNHLPIAD